jgi:hypothetical protein
MAKSITVKNIVKTLGWPLLIIWIAVERMDLAIYYILGSIAFFIGGSFLVEIATIVVLIIGIYIIGLGLVTAIWLDWGDSAITNTLFGLGVAITGLIIRAVFVLVH